MGRVHRAVYVPNAGDADRYDELFAEYTALHDHFGRGGSDVMHTLEAHPPRGGRGRGRVTMRR